MSDLMESARADAVQAIADGIMLAAADAIATHGDDPDGFCIVAAGLSVAIHRMDRADPRIRRILAEMIR